MFLVAVAMQFAREKAGPRMCRCNRSGCPAVLLAPAFPFNTRRYLDYALQESFSPEHSESVRQNLVLPLSWVVVDAMKIAHSIAGSRLALFGVCVSRASM